MTRAHGRKNATRAVQPGEIDPDSPEGQGLGMSNRNQGYPSPIPGGRTHITNAETMRREPPTADAGPEVKPINAHGVPPGTHTSRERAEAERGPNSSHNIKPPAPRAPGTPTPVPVPVYIVADQDAMDTWASGTMRWITVPSTAGSSDGTPWARVAGRNPKRVELLILNESTSSNIRIAQRPSDLANGGGALIPKSMGSYLKLKTQDEVYAVSADSGTPVLSIIEVFNTLQGE